MVQRNFPSVESRRVGRPMPLYGRRKVSKQLTSWIPEDHAAAPYVVYECYRRASIGQHPTLEEMPEILKAAMVRLRRGESPHCIYFMRLGNRVKIGTTRDLAKRVVSIQPEEVLAVRPGSFAMEHLIHAQFADLRVSGEWFRLAEPLVGFIVELREGRCL